MNNVFQRPAGFMVMRFIAKHQCCYAFSIDLIAVEDRVAKSLSKLLNYVRKFEDLMSDLVSIDHNGFEVIGEPVRNGTLAGTNSAENAQNRRLVRNRHRLGNDLVNCRDWQRNSDASIRTRIGPVIR